jgi:hypothetical protein
MSWLCYIFYHSSLIFDVANSLLELNNLLFHLDFYGAHNGDLHYHFLSTNRDKLPSRFPDHTSLDFLSSYATYCPATVCTTMTPAPSYTGYTISPTSNTTTNYLSHSLKPISVIPTPSPSTVQARSGSSIHTPRVMVWLYSAILLLFFIPSFVGAFLSSE